MLSIGTLSAATGIPPDTIRTWERRYGFPISERKPSGHRLYPLSTVARLRRIAQAIAGGHRAAEVLPASEHALDDLLTTLHESRVAPPSTVRSAPRPSAASSTDVDALLLAVHELDAERLKRDLQAAWAQMGPLGFLSQRAAPFLTALGVAWKEGSLDVRHEHFGSSVLGDLLRSVRLPLEERAAGPMVVLATLPGELHGLGLQMAALVFALAEWRTLVIGVDTPVEQIAALAREAPIVAVALSCVQPRGRSISASIRSLRRRLPRRIALIVGGAAAPVGVRLSGVEVMSDLLALDHWLRSRRVA